MRHSFLLIVMITVSLEPKWRHFAQVNIADIFMLSSKLPKQNENIQVHHATWVMIGSRFRSKVKTLHARPTSLLKGETKSGGPSGMSWQHTFSSAPRPSSYRSLKCMVKRLLHKNCDSRVQSASTTEMQRADSRLSSILSSPFSAPLRDSLRLMYALIRILLKQM